MKYADYIKEIEIDSLWSGKKHIVWTLDPHVNVLSGINGVGKSTILNKVVRSVNTNGDVINHLLKGVHITVEPADATHVRFDIIRSLDSPMLDNETLNLVDTRIRSALDFQLYHLQRKYLDYQVNIGNRIIEELQQGNTDAAQHLSEPKKRFQDMVDELFEETGKKIVRTENEIRFSQIGETLVPYQLSSGEKQMLQVIQLEVEGRTNSRIHQVQRLIVQHGRVERTDNVEAHVRSVCWFHRDVHALQQVVDDITVGVHAPHHLI